VNPALPSIARRRRRRRRRRAIPGIAFISARCAGVYVSNSDRWRAQRACRSVERPRCGGDAGAMQAAICRKKT
jgi:hypothetical protein